MWRGHFLFGNRWIITPVFGSLRSGYVVSLLSWRRAMWPWERDWMRPGTTAGAWSQPVLTHGYKRDPHVVVSKQNKLPFPPKTHTQMHREASWLGFLLNRWNLFFNRMSSITFDHQTLKPNSCNDCVARLPWTLKTVARGFQDVTEQHQYVSRC